MITAQVVLINPQGLVLGVSRKDDHNDFGLAGGKMDPQDNENPMLTAIRECKEETGLDIYDLKLVFAIHKSGNMGFTYLAQYTGNIEYDEPHVVKWLPFEILINGKFGRYNQMVSESLIDMGVTFINDIDVVELEADLNKFMLNNKFSHYTVSVDVVRKERNWLGAFVYILYLNGAPEGMCDIDEAFNAGIDVISASYGVKLRVPSYYYSK